MSEKATPQAPRPRFGSIVERETSRLTQLFVDSHTAILRGLSMLAPKHRRSRVRWIIAAGFLAVIGVLAAGRSTREFATSKVHDFYRAQTTPAAPPPPGQAPTVEPAPAVTASAVAWPSAAPVQVPAAVVAVQAAEPASPKEQASPAAVSSTGSRSTRAPKARGANRPRAAASQGGS